MSLYTLLLLLLLKNDLVVMKNVGHDNKNITTNDSAMYTDVHDFDDAYRKALDDLEGNEDIFALDRNPIASELDTFKVLYRARCCVW